MRSVRWSAPSLVVLAPFLVRWGVGFLAYSIGHSLGELTALLELAVRRSWDAPNSPQPRTQIRLAGKDFARSGATPTQTVLK
ncbi:hypothetical protein [Aquabacterium sp.]|uniref:hypothetical protein n=1 Tax=Aquabacterium sp. TaxID=1872578 RepID=UPI002489E2AF|nr:hypothetical protein [Aquabacterium sp.]MDI1261219.1 hypothetical protein [Aquabacterium sp.]